MKSAYDLLHELNVLGANMPLELHQRVLNGEVIPRAEAGQYADLVKEAELRWKELQVRLNLVPRYELMLQ